MRHASHISTITHFLKMGEGAQILLVQDPGNKGSRAVKVWGAWAAILKEKRWRFQWKSPQPPPYQSAERSPMTSLSCYCLELQGV